MAIRRHATSKIATQEDLAEILSFGFRGEALPAIASVSRMRILTRPRDAEVGHEIRVESGSVKLEREAGCPEGTRIEVADLFAQVPARRKFLKKPGTEWGHSIDWLGRLAGGDVPDGGAEAALPARPAAALAHALAGRRRRRVGLPQDEGLNVAHLGGLEDVVELDPAA